MSEYPPRDLQARRSRSRSRSRDRVDRRARSRSRSRSGDRNRRPRDETAYPSANSNAPYYPRSYPSSSSSRYPSSRAAPDGAKSQTRLFVKSLAPTVDNEALKEAFGSFGTVKEAFLLHHPDGKSRGCGFIEFVDESSARDAMERMNGYELQGQPITIEQAVLKGSANGQDELARDRVFVSGVPAQGSSGFETKIREAFSKYGSVTDFMLTRNPNLSGTVGAFVSMASEAEAQAALDGLNNTSFVDGTTANTVTFARKPRSAMGGGGAPGERSERRGGRGEGRGAGGDERGRLSTVCRFYNTPRGCKEGNQCRFIHPAGGYDAYPSYGAAGGGSGGYGNGYASGGRRGDYPPSSAGGYDYPSRGGGRDGPSSGYDRAPSDYYGAYAADPYAAYAAAGYGYPGGYMAAGGAPSSASSSYPNYPSSSSSSGYPSSSGGERSYARRD